MGNKKIPSLLGVFIVLVMIAGLAFATGGINQMKTFFTKASTGNAPEGAVQTANITDSSFVVYWSTKEAADGAVFYGTTPELGNIAVDERDTDGSIGKYVSHFVKVGNLTENTKYYFRVGQNDSTTPFEVTTGPKLGDTSALEPITGKALAANGSPLSDAIAVWGSPGASPIAALLRDDGSYDLPVELARTTDLASVFTPEDAAVDKVTISQGQNTATINCTLGASVLPEIKLSQTLSCADEVAEEDDSHDTATDSADVADESDASDEDGEGGFGALINKSPSAATTTTATGKDTTINIENGQSVTSDQPTFSGKVGPRQMVKIEIHSEEVYSATVVSGSNGTWTWTPPSTLSPGEHTAKLTIINEDGTTQTVTRTFYVTAGESILPITSGSSSGELTPISTPTPEPTPEEELIPTGVETPTILALTTGLIFTILSIGLIFILN